MALSPINVGATANDGTGDTWRDAFVKVNANEAEIAATAAANALAIAALAGLTKTYWFDANDTATTATPITHGAGATNTYLTNNALGSFTNSYNPDSKDALWNPSTNKFDFTSLKIGDVVNFRIDINLSNAAAQEVDLFMSAAEGSAGPYELNINHTYYKNASTLANNTAIFSVYIGDENTRTGSARFRFASVAAATIVVNGWFYQITEV
tara:strand:+ start:13827 stop:14456 length:630 start_codon:yes stop_codon:yes gene_type:complete